MKLSDTQLVILSAAANRENRFVLPLPKSLKGGAATKVINALIEKGVVEEIAAKLNEPRWREGSEEEQGTTLVLTEAGLAALDGDTGPTTAEKGKGRHKAGKAKKAPREPRQGQREAKGAPRSRSDSKQARLIEMLRRPSGATIEEIVEALVWQPHTVRGAIAGALKKKLGLAVTSEKVEGRGRVYRIATD